MAPATSSARKQFCSSAMMGSSPKLPKSVVKMPVKYSMTASTKMILSAASMTLPNAMNPRIIASGLNMRPSARATQMMVSGTRLWRICPNVRAS